MPKRSHKELLEIQDQFFLATKESLALLDPDVRKMAETRPAEHKWPWANKEETEPVLVLASANTVKFIISVRFELIDTIIKSAAFGSKISDFEKIKEIITPKGWTFPHYVAPNGNEYPLCLGDRTIVNCITFPVAVAKMSDGKLKPVRVIQQK